MDPRLLQFYIQELAHVRDSGAEFAARFPKIASRLAMDSTEVQDPYVERLLEGFAFLAARVQLRLHEEFPRFTEQLLNRISPNFLAPVPAMGIVQFNPNHLDASLQKGVRVDAGTVLNSQHAQGIQTACKFSVGHALTLWPLEIRGVVHGPLNGTPPRLAVKKVVSSALHINIRTTGQQALSCLPLEFLDFHVSCSDEYAHRLFDRVCQGTVAVCVRAQGQDKWTCLPQGIVQALGLDETQALLPADSRQFSGMRLLQEFFAFPQRFLFFRLGGLQPFLSQVGQAAFEVALCFADAEPRLDSVVDEKSLALNCTPVVNLFPHNCDRINLDESQHEVHLLPHRVKPMDFEVHSVLNIQAHGPKKVQAVPELYSGEHRDTSPDSIFHTLRRVPTQLSEKQMREGGRSSYIGSEVYLGLTQPTGVLAASHGLKQLAVQALCTNRDLPLLLPLGQGSSDLHWPGNLPLRSIRFLRGPSRPRMPVHTGQTCWQLIEHLSLNYLGLMDEGHAEGTRGAASISRLLQLHADPLHPFQQQLASSITAISARPTVQRICTHGRPAVVRGVQVTLTADDQLLQGSSLSVLGSVLAQYLASHVSLNSFVQTRLKCLNSGAVLEFPASGGIRPLL